MVTLLLYAVESTFHQPDSIPRRNQLKPHLNQNRLIFYLLARVYPIMFVTIISCTCNK